MSVCKNRHATVLACKECKVIEKDEWHPCFDNGTGTVEGSGEQAEPKPEVKCERCGMCLTWQGINIRTDGKRVCNNCYEKECEYEKECKDFLIGKCKEGDWNVCGHYPESTNEKPDVKTGEGLSELILDEGVMIDLTERYEGNDDWNMFYFAIEKLASEALTARLTAQAAEHDRVIKELKEKVLEAIPLPYEPDNDQRVLSDDEQGYNKAIAEITQSIKSAFGGGK